MKDNNHTFLVWDSDNAPPETVAQLVLWRTHSDSQTSTAISIPAMVEAEGDHWKQTLLSWVYELGERSLTTKSMIDALALRKDFSYWWMTSIAEKNTNVCPRFYDAVRLLVLEVLVARYGVKSIVIVTKDAVLARAMHVFCQNKKISCRWQKERTIEKKVGLLKKIYQCVPYPVRAIALLVKYSISRFRVSAASRSDEAIPTSQVIFFNYLDNMDAQSLQNNQFRSHYWTVLLDALYEVVPDVGWIHHYVPHTVTPTCKDANDMLKEWNHASTGREWHALLESYVTRGVVFSALKDYAYLCWKSVILRKSKYYYTPRGSHVDLWPLFEHEWFNSMRGGVAMHNCLMLNVFETVVSRLPKQRIGIFLQENFSWERALIYAWKNAGHGQLVGVPHATIRYWHLSYFSDPRAYSMRKNSLPIPDLVAVNGQHALTLLIASGYPVQNLKVIEALRYLYLKQFSAQKNLANSHVLTLLVCGDIDADITHAMLRLLTKAACDLSREMSCIIKPHPNCPIDIALYPDLSITLSNARLNDLMPQCDVIITSNATSAAVDAYFSGIPLIQILDGKTFNMSPLRGMDKVCYVSSVEALTHQLEHFRNPTAEAVDSMEESSEAHTFFNLDETLPNWRKLLSESICETHTLACNAV